MYVKHCFFASLLRQARSSHFCKIGSNRFPANSACSCWHEACNYQGKTRRKGGRENENRNVKTGSIHRSRGGAGDLRDLRAFAGKPAGRRSRHQVRGNAFRAAARFMAVVPGDRACVNACGRPCFRHGHCHGIVHSGVVNRQRFERYRRTQYIGCG